MTSKYSAIKGIVGRQIYICPCCRAPMMTGRRRSGLVLLTMDHIRMRSEGGEDETENLRAMCKECNEVLPTFRQCVGALACHISIIVSDPMNRTSKWRNSPLRRSA